MMYDDDGNFLSVSEPVDFFSIKRMSLVDFFIANGSVILYFIYTLVQANQSQSEISFPTLGL